jgi:hypothetical protein
VEDEVNAAKAANEVGLVGFLFAILSDPDDEGVVFLRNVGLFPDYTALQARSLRIVEHEIQLSKVKNCFVIDAASVVDEDEWRSLKPMASPSIFQTFGKKFI